MSSELGEGTIALRHHLEAEFECVPESVRAAREFVKAALVAWGLDDSDGNVALLTSEVATNAVIHAQTPFRLRIHHEPPTVVVRVADGSVHRAARRDSPAGPEAQDGRGLVIVDEVSDTWGSRAYNGGKEVWFALEVPASRCVPTARLMAAAARRS